MNLRCVCGTILSDVGSPNDIEHLLISNRSMETLQDFVDAQVEKDSIVDEWPEHWERSGAVEVWKCYACKRLYFYPKGAASEIVVYAIEKIGIQN